MSGNLLGKLTDPEVEINTTCTINSAHQEYVEQRFLRSGSLISGDHLELAGEDIIDESNNGSTRVDELGVLDNVHIINHALLQLGEGQEINVAGISTQAFLEDTPDIIVAEGEHTTVSVVDDVDLVGAEELLRDGKGAQSIRGDTATGVANDMGITNAQANGLLRVQTSVHACHNSSPEERE